MKHPLVRSALVLGCMLALAGAAILAVGRLQADATGARDSQLKLIGLRLDIAQIQQVPWGASPDEGDDPASVRDELIGDQQQIERTLAELSRNGGLPERARVEAPFRRTTGALWQIFRAVSKGDNDATGKPSDLAARQAAIADEALQTAAARNRVRAVRSLRESRIGSAAVILLLFLAFAWFYGRATRARRIAEALAADNRRLLAVTQAEALTDPLTGLGNRRAMIADLESVPADSQTMVALFDLDGFKQYNDTFGHPAGDAVLQRLGTRLAEAVGEQGRAYRMGGDEFCVLASADRWTANELASRAAISLSEHGVGFSIVCSYGVALMPADATTAGEVLQLADERMYEHKHSSASTTAA